jgi:hypothetical protein
VNYHGQAKFAFAITGPKKQYAFWRNGAKWNDTINVNVANGRYIVLLGGQGMNPLPTSLFANHDELYVKVFFSNNDGQGLRHLAPDQRITAVPYAKVAEMVKPGAITTAQLNEQILKHTCVRILYHAAKFCQIAVVSKQDRFLWLGQL